MNAFARRWTCAALAVFLVALSGGAAAVQPSGSAPAAVFPETRFEFKPVIDGAAVLHDFLLRNTGSAPLNIHDVKTG
jgi:hypothetical protein